MARRKDLSILLYFRLYTHKMLRISYIRIKLSPKLYFANLMALSSKVFNFVKVFWSLTKDLLNLAKKRFKVCGLLDQLELSTLSR